MRRGPATAAVGLGALLLSAAGGAENARVHHYRVSIDPQLTALEVEARIQGRVLNLRADERDAAQALREVRLCDGGQPLRLRRGRIDVGHIDNPCVRYRYVLKDSASRPEWLRGGAILDRLTQPADWLWRPPPEQQAEIQVQFHLPPGIRVSVPWLSAGPENVYRFESPPDHSSAVVAFGAFDYREIEVPGAVLRVSLLRDSGPPEPAKIAQWLKAAATNVSLAYGRFPNPSPQVLVVPVGQLSSEAVPFGRVLRDGGEAVQFFVNPARPLEEFTGDWTATHEFSHLLLPYVREKWISEGFASYYQNVLMARAGEYSEMRAWQKLHEGFERGRISAPGTSPNKARMGAGLMKIYWSGAAVALLADVRLRRYSDGRQSLDSVLAQLQACCLPAGRSWRGRELFEQLDKFAPRPVFVPLYDEYADAPGFPALRGLYRQLGIAPNGGQILLSQDAPDSEIRRQIMAR